MVISHTFLGYFWKAGLILLPWGIKLTKTITKGFYQKVVYTNTVLKHKWLLLTYKMAQSVTFICQLLSVYFPSKPGLPPDSLAVDYQRLYWSSNEHGAVFSCNKSNCVDIKKQILQNVKGKGLQQILAYGSHLQPLPGTCMYNLLCSLKALTLNTCPVNLNGQISNRILGHLTSS